MTKLSIKINIIKLINSLILNILFVYYTVLSNGSVTYSEVQTFLHKNPSMILPYKSIRTLLNESLILSENHLVFTRKFGSDEFSPM